MKNLFIFSFFAIIAACNNDQENKEQKMNYKSIGAIERFDAALDDIISA